jgi:hypothetical protein
MAKAFALYIGDKAVAFCVFDDYDIGGSSRTGLVAYDFSDFKDKIDKDHEERTAGKSDWEKRNIKKQNISSHKMKKNWNDKEEEYTGEAMTTAELKAFIDSLYILSDGKELGCKLVLLSSESAKKRGARYQNMREKDVFSGLEALANRLKKYKLSKKPTVSSIKEFLALAGKNAIKEVQFDGRAFSTEGSTYNQMNPADLLKGRAFSLSYKAVEPGEHDSLEISYKYDVNTMMIVPFKASWYGKDESGKKISQTAVLHTEQFFKHSFGVKSLDKKEVITKMLTFMKDGKFHQVREMIKAAKQSDMDWHRREEKEREGRSITKKGAIGSLFNFCNYRLLHFNRAWNCRSWIAELEAWHTTFKATS